MLQDARVRFCVFHEAHKCWCEQGRDVGLYKPPPELQGKNWAKYNLNKPMSSQPMSAPSTQNMADSLLHAKGAEHVGAHRESAGGSCLASAICHCEHDAACVPELQVSCALHQTCMSIST